MARGQVVPCVADPAGGWTSDDSDERAAAAVKCGECPLLRQCREFARSRPDDGLVWGGLVPRTAAARKAARRHNL